MKKTEDPPFFARILFLLPYPLPFLRLLRRLLSFGPIMLSLLILAGLLFQTNAVTILSILDTMCEGVGRQALEKIIFRQSKGFGNCDFTVQ